MISERRSSDALDARLAFPGRQEVPVASVEELRDALRDLPLMMPGQTACLSRGPENFIKATRRGDLWSAVTRRGGWWTLAAFTAGMTTGYSARQARESRAAGSLWKRIALKIASQPAEYELSTAQVETIFVEYLAGARFSIPQSGA